MTVDQGNERWDGSPERTNAWAHDRRERVLQLVEAALLAHGSPYPLSPLCIGIGGGMKPKKLSDQTVRRYILGEAVAVPGMDPPPLEVRNIDGQDMVWFRRTRPTWGQSAVRDRMNEEWERKQWL